MTHQISTASDCFDAYNLEAHNLYNKYFDGLLATDEYLQGLAQAAQFWASIATPLVDQENLAWAQGQAHKHLPHHPAKFTNDAYVGSFA